MWRPREWRPIVEASAGTVSCSSVHLQNGESDSPALRIAQCATYRMGAQYTHANAPGERLVALIDAELYRLVQNHRECLHGADRRPDKRQFWRSEQSSLGVA